MIELCPESGFAYYAFGKNIFKKNSIGEGYGADAVVFSDGICSLNDGFLHEIPDVPLGNYANYKIDDALKRQKAWIEISQ
jgi:hypothetical protein